VPTVEELTEILSDPSKFFILATCFEREGGLYPHEYQSRLLNDESKRIAMRVCRQGGKSLAVAVKATYNCIMRDNYRVLIISPTREQTSILFRKITDFIRENTWMFDLIEWCTKTRMKFKNGSEIFTTAANSVRGYSPHLLIIDEAAFVIDDFYMAAEPTLAATNGQLILISTPFGTTGRFHNAFSNRDYSIYHVPGTKIPHISKDFLEQKRAEILENEFLQEYMAEFIEEADTYFPKRIITASIGDYVMLREPDKNFTADYFLGVDIARYGTDETVFVISYRKRNTTEDTIRVIHIEATSKKPLTDTIGRIKLLHKEWNFTKIYIDETSLGGGVVDVLVEAKLPIVPITFNKKCESSSNPGDSNKEAMYKNLKWMMEKNAEIREWNFKYRDKIKPMVLEIPNDNKLINQLAELKYEYSSGGALSLFTDNERHHDDISDALALSLFAFIRRNREYTGFYVG